MSIGNLNIYPVWFLCILLYFKTVLTYFVLGGNHKRNLCVSSRYQLIWSGDGTEVRSSNLCFLSSLPILLLPAAISKIVSLASPLPQQIPSDYIWRNGNPLTPPQAPWEPSVAWTPLLQELSLAETTFQISYNIRI